MTLGMHLMPYSYAIFHLIILFNLVRSWGLLIPNPQPKENRATLSTPSTRSMEVPVMTTMTGYTSRHHVRHLMQAMPEPTWSLSNESMR